MDGFQVNDDIFEVDIRDFGLGKGGHLAFAVADLVADEIGVNGVLADAQLRCSLLARVPSQMATGTGLGKNQSPCFGFRVGLSWARGRIVVAPPAAVVLARCCCGGRGQRYANRRGGVCRRLGRGSRGSVVAASRQTDYTNQTRQEQPGTFK